MCDLVTQIRDEISSLQMGAKDTFVAGQVGMTPAKTGAGYSANINSAKATEFYSLSERTQEFIRSHPIFCQAVGIVITTRLLDSAPSKDLKKESNPLQPPERSISSDITALLENRRRTSNSKEGDPVKEVPNCAICSVILGSNPLKFLVDGQWIATCKSDECKSQVIRSNDQSAG